MSTLINLLKKYEKKEITKVTVSSTIKESKRKKLQDLAKENNTTESALIRIAIYELLEKMENK